MTALFSGTFTSIGADAESDPALRTRCLSQWGALRIEKTADGLIYLARTAAPAIHSVVTIASNPRGPGTVDVYLAGDNATASGGEVTAVQAALDLAIFGNGTVDKLVKALAAPTATQAVAANVYVRGTTAAAATAALTDAWRAFLLTVPIGGFDLSPWPTSKSCRSTSRRRPRTSQSRPRPRFSRARSRSQLPWCSSVGGFLGRL